MTTITGILGNELQSTDPNMSLVKTFGPSRKTPSLSKKNLISISLKLHHKEYTGCFNVHKSLICLTSNRTREVYRKEQNPINGSCPICGTKVKPDAGNLDICLGLFGSIEKYIHKSCHATWSEAIHADACSCVCRMPWSLHDEDEPDKVWPEARVTERALSMYANWFYTDDVGIPTDLKRGSDDLNDIFLEAWEIASAMQDDTFKMEVIGAYLNRTMTGASGCDFSPKFIASIWSNERGDAGLKDFITDLCLTSPQTGWVREGHGLAMHPSYRERCDGLLWALGLRVMRSGRRQEKLEDLLEKYTRGMYEWKADDPEVLAGVEKLCIDGA